MSIGPFDPTAGDYGSLNYVDPFGDTTADIGKSVAPAEPKTIMPVPQRPVQEKSTIPAKVSGGNVGISPITMQGAVSIPAESATVTNISDIYIPEAKTTTASRFGSLAGRAFTPAAKKAQEEENLSEVQRIVNQFAPLLQETYGESLTFAAPESIDNVSNSGMDWKNWLSYKEPADPSEVGGIKPVTDVEIASLRSVVSPIFERNIAQVQELNPEISYEDALQQAYIQDPTLQQVYSQFKFSPYRTTDDGSVYWYDPVQDKEIRTFEAKDPTALDSAFTAATIVTGFMGNPLAASALAGTNAARQGGDLGDVAKASIGAYLGSQAAGGEGMFANVGNAIAPAGSALAKGISAGAASGVATAVQGGDLGDVVKSGLLGGVGGYLQANAAEAAMLQDATNAALEIGDSATALQYADEARKLAAQADLVSTIANSAKAVDAAVSGDYVSALASGMQAAGTNLTEFTSNQLTGMFGEEAFANLNIDDVAAGVNKVATSLAEGKDIEEALQKGVTTYIQKGGSLGEAGDQVRDYLESAGGALYDKVIKPAGDMLTGLVDKVSSFDTPEGIEAIEDAVRVAGIAVDDKVLQPIKEGAESVYEPLSGPDVNLPDVAVNLPDVNVDLPSMDLSGMFDGLMSYLPSQRTQRATQQTTDPVLADLSNLYLQQAEPEELLATRDYLSGLLRTI